MADFIVTLLMFFLISVVVISIGLLIAICVLVVKIVNAFLEDMQDDK